MNERYEHFRPLIEQNKNVIPKLRRSARISLFLMFYGSGLSLVGLINYWALDYSWPDLLMVILGQMIAGINMWDRRRTLKRIRNAVDIDRHLRGFCTTFSDTAMEHHYDQLIAACHDPIL